MSARFGSPLEALFGDLLSEFGWSSNRPRWHVSGSGASVFVSDSHARVVLAAPGVPADDFDVEVVDGALHIDASAPETPSAGDGERELTRQPVTVLTADRSHRVRVIGPQPFDPASVSAHVANGVLTVTVDLQPADEPSRTKIKVTTDTAG